ncbi:hypothetical protein P691DRAFT_777216 [Macrolepiota fuliginosa MF-IS2]|uniref:Uncharacterized protein n=1 Tax=Macrolepiota fuliginosa MF-IS2 TaxID=1400762 RepID=A0A9P5XA80_9AGAR|nr:hypothetical protein P691DRAFT_777216 [Macrolepiota fuliginosa MF-IS2]
MFISQNPTAPYSLQVYTSTATTPFIIPAGDQLSFDWDVPFAPGTQYQICMFDKNGVSGGCQAMYTVVQNMTVANPVCRNVTAPPQLAIEGEVAEGPISQYGFINQCTDISITPKGGKPPYTLTISPPLHPPYNITSKNGDPIVWTVSLSRSYPFFMSLFSSDGLMWANGPMHSGGPGPDDCLAPGSIPHGKAAGIAAGASFATFIGGLLLGYAGLRLFRYIQSRRAGNLELGPFRELRETDRRWTLGTVMSGDSDLEKPLPHIPQRFASLRDGDEWDPTAEPQGTAAGSDESDSHNPRFPVRTRTVILHYDGGRIRAESQGPNDVVELPPEYRRPSVYSDSNAGRMSASTETPVPIPSREGIRSTN